MRFSGRFSLTGSACPPDSLNCCPDGISEESGSDSTFHMRRARYIALCFVAAWMFLATGCKYLKAPDQELQRQSQAQQQPKGVSVPAPPASSAVGDERLACVEVDGKWRYVDTTGKWAIEPQFGSSGDFSEGLANISNIGGDNPEHFSGFVDA